MDMRPTIPLPSSPRVVRSSSDSVSTTHTQPSLVTEQQLSSTSFWLPILRDTLGTEAPEELVIREVDVVVLDRLWGGSGDSCVISKATVSFDSGRSHTFVVKHVTGPSKRHRSNPVKSAIKGASYRIESRFLCAHANTLRGRSVHVPVAFYYQDDQSTGRCVTVMEDLKRTHDVHIGELGDGLTRESLSWLARFHAVFWGRRDLLEHQGAATVWSHGTYWTLGKRRSDFDEIVDIWNDEYKTRFGRKRRRGAFHDLGLRLRRAAYALNSLFSPLEEQEPCLGPRSAKPFAPPNTQHTLQDYYTVVHGDYKAENIFFSEDRRSCAVCDFQWCGVGLGVQDVFHLLSTSLQGGPPSHTYEVKLLRYYHDKLKQHGACTDESYPFKLLRFHYDMTVVDYCRYVVGNGNVFEEDWEMLERADYILREFDGGDVFRYWEDYSKAIRRGNKR